LIKQGEIYLVDFGKRYKSEIGKIRPAVIMQNNFLNRVIKKKIYKQVLVVPVSTSEVEDDFRLFLPKRDRLQKDSFIVSNWICTVDIEHVQVQKGVIARLSSTEIEKLKEKICNII